MGRYAAGRRPQTGSHCQLPCPRRGEPASPGRRTLTGTTAAATSSQPAGQPRQATASSRAHVLPAADPRARHRPPPEAGTSTAPRRRCRAPHPTWREKADALHTPTRAACSLCTPNMAPGESLCACARRQAAVAVGALANSAGRK